MSGGGGGGQVPVGVQPHAADSSAADLVLTVERRKRNKLDLGGGVEVTSHPTELSSTVRQCCQGNLELKD